MIDRLKDIYRFVAPKFQTIHLEHRVEAVPRYHLDQPHPQLHDLIKSGQEKYADFLALASKNEDHFDRLQSQLSDTGFLWRNDFFPAWDTVMLHTMLGHFKPKRYLEVGSGYSTIVAQQAIKDHEIDTKIISVDPHPRADIDHFADTLYRKRLETIDISILTDLDDGDILFIDNSHRLLPNSDVMVFFLEVLPQLKPGVVVHIHDVYLPYDYPENMCQRMYSEQYALAIALLHAPERYEILMPSFYVSQIDALSQILAPIWDSDSIKDPESHGGSFWIGVR